MRRTHADWRFCRRGKLLFDFHSFPLRIAEVADHPYRGVLSVGYSDSIFLRSRGGVTPSGWSCDRLPYLVEFDNFGRSNPGETEQGAVHLGLGRDYLVRTSARVRAQRLAPLRLELGKKTDAHGHLQMPGSRIMTPGKPDAPRWFWANTRSDACPQGFNTEDTIREFVGDELARSIPEKLRSPIKSRAGSLITKEQAGNNFPTSRGCGIAR